MERSATSVNLIMKAIAHHPGCGLDELVTICPDLTWRSEERRVGKECRL